MNNKNNIKIDFSEFAKSAKQHNKKDAPKAFAEGFRKLAHFVELSEKKQLKTDLNVKSNFVINSIKAFPTTPNQTRKLARDIATKHKFIAQVATNQKTSFLSMHDTGGTRTNQNDANYLPSGENKNVLAVPSKALRKRKYRGKNGRVKKSYQPKTLLKNFNKDEAKTKSKRKLAFLMRAKSGHLMIVKRTTKKEKPITVLYHFLDSSHIDDDWNWSEVGFKTVKKRYRYCMADTWRVANGQSPNKKYRRTTQGKGTTR